MMDLYFVILQHKQRIIAIAEKFNECANLAAQKLGITKDEVYNLITREESGIKAEGDYDMESCTDGFYHLWIEEGDEIPQLYDDRLVMCTQDEIENKH